MCRQTLAPKWRANTVRFILLSLSFVKLALAPTLQPIAETAIRPIEKRYAAGRSSAQPTTPRVGFSVLEALQKCSGLAVRPLVDGLIFTQQIARCSGRRVHLFRFGARPIQPFP